MASLPTTDPPTPDPSRGVFETILIFEDRPIELVAHLERLRTSLRTVYGAEEPRARELVLANSRGGWLGRLRITVEPATGGGLRSSVLVAPFDPDNVFPTGPFTSSLQSFRLKTGWGDHKWADREVLGRAETSAGHGAAPLLVTDDGVVLEASRANVFAVCDRTVVTPPLDGSILPGVARAGLIEEAVELGFPVREETLTLERLRSADEVFLTGSLRGVEPIHAIDDVPVAVEGPITVALAAALRQRWFAGAP